MVDELRGAVDVVIFIGIVAERLLHRQTLMDEGGEGFSPLERRGKVNLFEGFAQTEVLREVHSVGSSDGGGGGVCARPSWSRSSRSFWASCWRMLSAICSGVIK